MSIAAGGTVQRIDQFFAMHSGRADYWRDLTNLAQEWALGRKQRKDVEAAREDLSVIEAFHAYPGPRLFGTLGEYIARDDRAGGRWAAHLELSPANGRIHGRALLVAEHLIFGLASCDEDRSCQHEPQAIH